MSVYAEGRVEHQKRTQTATTLWPFGFVFGVQLGSLEKKKARRGPVRAALVHIHVHICIYTCAMHNMSEHQYKMHAHMHIVLSDWAGTWRCASNRAR